METPPPLPKGYEWVETPEGRAVVPKVRYWSIHVLIVALVFAGAYGAFFRHQRFGALFAIAIALPFAAIRITRSRDEWQVGPDRITLRRRTLGKATTRLETRRVFLDRGMDGDYGPVCELYALEPSELVPPVEPKDELSRSLPENRLMVVQGVDCGSVRSFADWVARTANVEIVDRATIPPADTH